MLLRAKLGEHVSASQLDSDSKPWLFPNEQARPRADSNPRHRSKLLCVRSSNPCFSNKQTTHCHRVHKHENFSNLARLRNCSTTRRQREKTARQVRRVPKQTQKTTSAAERHRSITGCSGRTLNAPHFGNPMIA